MSLNAPARSQLGAYVRSVLGARAKLPIPEPEGFVCVYDVRTGTAGLGPTSGLIPVSDANCGCSTIPATFETRKQGSAWTYRNAIAGLGWEDPPHPAVKITGQTSGAVVTIPQHCAFRCDPGSTWWGGYSYNPGQAGCDAFVDQSSTIQNDLPVSNGIWRAFYLVEGPGTPFLVDERATIEITYTPAVLPNPGPFAILSARPHRFISGATVLTLDAPPRYTTAAAVYITGTSSYNGMQQANPWGDDYQHGPNDITIWTPFVASETGTFLRVYQQAWDCWHNDQNPSGPAPPLPPAPS